MLNDTLVREQAQHKLDNLRHEARVARALPPVRSNDLLRSLTTWWQRVILVNASWNKLHEA
ncbi:hypothetical protein [Deinococcus yavapaiensis]|uniref:Uncharacterized protein n=1 Tax=Deinococcus yavapaiensis KR-236 TaxID=694435 RepID=A0A318SG75_9DEIO|nr:hypothetical protein [Deinococcus yavapaiensis]PYE48665.1 hypothetical protein DES52_12825 [Deinococcus yavapaiensis KR-236]